MCGIVGLFLKNEALQPDLGRLTGLMLRELCDRGPDSAGFAVYGGEAGGTTKICMVSRNGARRLDARIAKQLGAGDRRRGRGRGDRGPRDLQDRRARATPRANG